MNRLETFASSVSIDNVRSWEWSGSILYVLRQNQEPAIHMHENTEKDGLTTQIP